MTTYTYIVTRISDGAEVFQYNADQPVEWESFGFATHVHTAKALQPPDPVPPVPPVKISRLAFLSRFTDAEAIAIDLSSQGATVQAAAMRRYTNKVNAAEFIDLSRPDTRTGVVALEAVGLLAVGRATVILDTPPTESEVWNG